MQIRFPVRQGGKRLGKPFQIYLNAGMLVAANLHLYYRLPNLYDLPVVGQGSVRYQREPWSGEGIEEFADPLTVLERGWGDCDDLVIFRGGELLAQGKPCHARIIRKGTRYHTQLTRDFDGLVEDPCLQRLGKPWLFQKKGSLLLSL